jgi:hypothetical protein
MRMVIGLVVAFTLPLTLATGCNDGNSAAGTGGSAASSQAPACPKGWAADWQAWADKVGMTVWCPTYLPSPIDGRIGPQNEYNTARSPGRHWQLGYVWRDEDFSGLVHVVFEGMPDKLWPPRCGGMMCFAGPSGRSTVAGHDVRWYSHNMGSSSGHIAAVFHDDGNAYIVSMHVFGTVDAKQTKAMVQQMVAGLVAVPQSM